MPAEWTSPRQAPAPATPQLKMPPGGRGPPHAPAKNTGEAAARRGWDFPPEPRGPHGIFRGRCGGRGACNPDEPTASAAIRSEGQDAVRAPRYPASSSGPEKGRCTRSQSQWDAPAQRPRSLGLPTAPPTASPRVALRAGGVTLEVEDSAGGKEEDRQLWVPTGGGDTAQRGWAAPASLPGSWPTCWCCHPPDTWLHIPPRMRGRQAGYTADLRAPRTQAPDPNEGARSTLPRGQLKLTALKHTRGRRHPLPLGRFCWGSRRTVDPRPHFLQSRCRGAREPAHPASRDADPTCEKRFILTPSTEQIPVKHTK